MRRHDPVAHPSVRMAIFPALTALFLMLIVSSFSVSAMAEEPRPSVYVVNYPLQYFAARIAGDAALVVFPAPPDEDPAFWMPSPEVVAAYQGADLVLLNGAGYAGWIDKVSLRRSRLVDTSASFADRLIHTNGGSTHQHGPAGAHSHAGMAFTTWLDFSQAALQVAAVTEALSHLLPEHATELESRSKALVADLQALDARLATLTQAGSSTPLLASHPVYQYLARRYALDLESVLWEPEAIPDAAALAALERIRDSHPARWMIWEGAPAPESVALLQGLGMESLVFDPCAQAPEQGDFMSVMRDNLSALERVFR